MQISEVQLHYFLLFTHFVSLLLPGTFSYLQPNAFSSIRLSPSVYTGQLGPIVGDTYLPTSWIVTQWGILEDLPSVPQVLPDGTWKISNSFASVRSSPLSDVLFLTQDARDSRFACNEFDLNVEPASTVVYPGYTDPLIPIASSPTLADSKTLRIDALQKVQSSSRGLRCPAGENLGSTMVALIFSSAVTEQIIFYQIVTFDSRGAFFSGFWFFQGPKIFGVNDSVSLLGANALQVGDGGILYQLEVLSRVRSLITHGPVGLDKDLSHWKLRGFYLSSNTNGEATIESVHGHIRLIGG